MQTLTPDLTAILKDRFQAAASGFRGRVEIDTPTDGPPEDVLLDGTVTAGWNEHIEALPNNPERVNDGSDATTSVIANWVGSGASDAGWWQVDLGAAPHAIDSMSVTTYGTITGNGTGNGDLSILYSDDAVAWTTIATLGNWPGVLGPDAPHVASWAAITARYWRLLWTCTVHTLAFRTGILVASWNLLGPTRTVSAESIRPTSISIDKSLRLVSDQASIAFSNESQGLGFGPTSILSTNQRMRVLQWYGDDANEIVTFTGIIDAITDHRDVLTTTIACRDMMAILIDQTFSATAPQQTGETGAVRTKANGVYTSMEVSDIVSDILDRAGWPTDARAITGTSYVLDEYIVTDGATWAETIIGDERLTGLVGYSAWADELGVFHFAPTTISQHLTVPIEPVYTFESGTDIVALDDQTDQYDLRTRVKVRGPLTTQTLQDTWRELWRTSKITEPVGIWYAPSEPTIIRVLSRATKRIYRLRQSDRAVLGSTYLGGVISHPLGLSGDPADSTIYWVLQAPWKDTGSTTGNSVKKVRKSDNVVLATYSIPDGRWSALKVSTSNLWLTNLDTDRFYKRSKVDGSAVANYSHTVSAVVQTNPSGIMVDGSTLYLFWSNGGTTARFLKCDVSAPGTVTGIVKTAGTSLHGGEMDTTTHTDCYGDSDSLNLTAKFTLLAAVDQTTQVFAEVVDTDLEDELGSLAQSQDREHDTHTTDPDHPFEVRRMTLDLRVITNLAQATETAQRQLDIASQRRRVLDVGIIGNPALQKTDPIAVVDAVTGLNDVWAIDTYRTSMTADSTYLGTLALLPIAALDDDPEDDGTATE